MRRLRGFAARLRGLFAGPAADRELNDELEAHLRLAADEYERRGMSPPAARRAAVLDFGGVEQTKEAYREQRGLPSIEGLLQDVRLALRSLARSPLFTITTVLTLTVGVGLTTSMYHVIDRVLLRPLPYPDPDRVVYLGWHWNKGGDADALSPPKFTFWHDNARVFDGLATSRWFGASLDLGGSQDADALNGQRVTSDFFRVIELPPMLGRGFAPGEYTSPAAPVVILSHALWATRFGSNPRVLGRVIRVNDEPLTIVGVMPPPFDVAGHEERADLLTPFAFSVADLGDGGNNYTVVGRLRPGVTSQALDADMARVFQAYRIAYAGLTDPDDGGVVTLSAQKLLVGNNLTKTLWILLVATGFVLLLACANASNLLFVRALGQRQQFAVCLALGAGRGRIVRRVVVEAVLLGVAAAVLAVLMSLGSLRALLALSNGAFLLDRRQLGIDSRVVTDMSLLAVTAMIAVGVIVALAATKIDLARGLSEANRRGSASVGQHRVRNVLVTTEVATASVLLLGALLLVVSFARVLNVDAGFRRDGVVTAVITHAPSGYDSAQAVERFEANVLDELRATPGVRTASAGRSLPLQRGWNLGVTIADRPDASEGAAEWRAVTPEFFQTFDIPIVRGRAFTKFDDRGSAPVVIVSKAFASAFWPGRDAIGQRIMIGRYKGRLIGPKFDDPPREVVGVVPDLRDMSLTQDPHHTVWIPDAQIPPGMVTLQAPVFAVSTQDTRAGTLALRRAILHADARMTNVRIETMRQIVADSVATRRFNMILMAVFAGVALLLTCIGIYGVVAYNMSRRTGEIGIRVALGASPGGVTRMVITQGMRPVVFGLVVGLFVGMGVSRFLAHMLYRVNPRSPEVFGASALLIVMVAIVATWIPAIRASRISPVEALRAE